LYNSPMENNTETPAVRTNFIHELIDKDNASGRFQGRVHTRFPPEPNGYLHIGHATSIILNSGIARHYGGKFNLRFDDTNPSKEEQEYVDSIIEDVRWLGGEFEDRLFFASDYFQRMYDWAVELIKKGKAYVCDLTPDQVREHRGAPGEPGKDSPNRNRTVEENLDLFERMRKGEFPDGSRTLRAKIDMAHPNLNMRDPVMYRILHAEHHRQGKKWCVYPMYDWAHGLEDSIEGRDEKTFKEAEEESDINLPNIFPLFQLCLGARVEIVRGLSFRAEAGLWDGVMLRGGLGYRF